MITDVPPDIRNGKLQYQVLFPDFTDRVSEDQLRACLEGRMNPIDLLREGNLGTPKDLRRTLIHVRLTGKLADLIYSMEATNTDFYAYQFKPVIKLLKAPTNSILIADEVGMGKTIEAGLIWTELRSRFNFKRLVILCPAALREKWRDELSNKFGVQPSICDPRETLRILGDRDAHARGFSIICSTQSLRPPSNWEHPEYDTAEAAKLARFLQGNESEDPLVDLLVVDEAHHMRNSGTQTNRLGQMMRRVSDYLVLLSATPIHNHSKDLHSLLHLLDPDTFSNFEDCDEILTANRPLVRARETVLRGNTSAANLISELREAMTNRLLKGNRQLEALLSRITDNALNSIPERSQIAYRLETANLLGHTMTRTRKRDVEENRVVRDPKAEFIPMTVVEQEFYDFVTKIVSDYARDRAANEAFLLVAPQRQTASCMPAALKSWRARQIEIPEDQLSYTEQDEEKHRQMGPLIQKLVQNSSEFVDLDALVRNDSKYERLKTVLNSIFSDMPKQKKEKVVIFSTFHGTLKYLSKRLDKDNIRNTVLRGGSRQAKEDIIDEFWSPGGPSVLLSSEVGGEGIDLQCSWILINYDLPWNPMRVEQRIGRIDRIGQESEKILIWNLFYAETVDARIYKRLYDKLDLCRNALGDFEAILGEDIQKLTQELLVRGLTPQQQEERIRRTALALEAKKLDEERLEAEAADLVAYGDYILRQVDAARDLHRWIGGTDLFTYVHDFLNLNYPGCDIGETDKEKHRYKLSLTTEAKYALSEFVRQNNLSGQTNLTEPNTTPVTCQFENRVSTTTYKSIEIISQFHPLIRFVSAKIAETVAQIRPAVSVKVAIESLDKNLSWKPQPGIYVIAVSLWSVRGLREVEQLVYAAVSLDDADRLLRVDEAERLASVCASHGKPWLEAKHDCDLNNVLNIANDRLFGSIAERFEVFVAEESAQNEDRADIQERNLERHFLEHQKSLQKTIDDMKAQGNTRLLPANEGRLKAHEERYKHKKRDIFSRRNVTDKTDDISVVIALVE